MALTAHQNEREDRRTCTLFNNNIRLYYSLKNECYTVFLLLLVTCTSRHRGIAELFLGNILSSSLLITGKGRA